MTAREPTLQSLDPLGALAGRPLTALAGIAAITLAVVLTVGYGRQIGSPVVAALAILVCAAACGALVWYSSPRRAPFRRRAAVLVTLAAVAASVLSTVASWGQNSLVRDDWGPVAIGLLLLALSPYRPPLEIQTLALVSAAAVAITTLAESPFFSGDVPPVTFVVVAATPILALALAGSAFSRTVIARIARWRARAETASVAQALNMQGGITRSVQQGRVSLLNRDVVPLFSGLVERSIVTLEDIERATAVSDAIRALMVAETERTWLDELILHPPSGTEAAVWPSVVSDPSHSADAMAFEQRAAVRALVGALGQRLAARNVSVRVTGTRRATFELSCSTDVGESHLNAVLAPYLAVLRAVFSDLSVAFARPSLTLRFCYDCQ
ncbi:MAG: hypothetical protein JWR33_1476 [Naasia sp.]|jgi:hypothetical protein|uniref:hypothetical protein n=1 Tax=Naasia sp. TaxID=2546198 RepID=UPI00262818A1|nr:hypothetical protein [Naasia sp.]MCU1570735.1 hypothetical protein [Naasia sp.]